MPCLWIASDHAGFELKELLKEHLKSHAPLFTIKDEGPQDDTRVDYPDFADRVCLKLKNQPEDRGLLICGSGQGMSMRANKYPFIRAALVWNEESTILSREHNNANIICFGARLVNKEESIKLIDLFLKTPFLEGRHKQRIQKVCAPLK